MSKTDSILTSCREKYMHAALELAREAGVVPISLGKRILRTETAALVALSFLIYHFEI